MREKIYAFFLVSLIAIGLIVLAYYGWYVEREINYKFGYSNLFKSDNAFIDIQNRLDKLEKDNEDLREYVLLQADEILRFEEKINSSLVESATQ